jgi:hypothetical protein
MESEVVGEILCIIRRTTMPQIEVLKFWTY